jgi:hypothetical protein
MTGDNTKGLALGKRLRRLARIEVLGMFVGAVVCAAMAVAATTPTVDPDVWWVAAAGRELLSRGRVQRINLFSYVEPAHPWLMHEWLLGPIYATGLSAMGPSFFTLLTIVTLTFGLYLVLSQTVGRASNPGIGLATAFVCLSCFSSRLLSARPSGIAVLMPLALTSIAFAPRFGRASVILSLAVVLVWTNVHGSFLLGIVLLLVATSLDTDRRRRVVAVVLSAFVTLLNPYGLSLHRFVAGYLLGREGIYREINANIREFQSVIGAFGATVGPIELTGWLLVAVLAALALRSRRYRIRAVFVLGLLVGALRQARHMELAGLLGCILLEPYAEELVASGRASELADAWRKRFVIGVVSFAALLGVGTFAVELRSRSDADWIDSGPDLLAALDAVPNDARLYVPFSRAGLAIWYGRPRGIHVYFDSRNDCYSARTFTTFLALGDGLLSDEQIASVIASTRTNAVLASAHHPLVEWAARRPEFRAMHVTGRFRTYGTYGNGLFGSAGSPAEPPEPPDPPDPAYPPLPEPPDPRPPVAGGSKPMLAPPSPPRNESTTTQVWVAGSQ